ncbi:unnamed protein product [Closterium sp. NIES-53]
MGRPVGRLSASSGGFWSPPENKLCLADALFRHEQQSISAIFQAPQSHARAPLGVRRTATSPCRVTVTRATLGGSNGEEGGESARAAAEQLTSLQRSLTQLLCVMGNLASAVGEVARAAGEVAEAAGAERGSGKTGLRATISAAAAANAATSAAAAAAEAGGAVAKAAAAAAAAAATVAAAASANTSSIEAASAAEAAGAEGARGLAPTISEGGGGGGGGVGDGMGRGLEGHELALALQRAFVQARIEGLGKPREEALGDFVDACMAARAQSLGFKDLQLKLLLAEAALPAPFSMMMAAGSGEEGEAEGGAGEGGRAGGREREGRVEGEEKREGEEGRRGVREEGVEGGAAGSGDGKGGGRGEEGDEEGVREVGQEERVEGDLDSDDERRSSALKALRGPFLAEEVRVRTLWVRLVYTTLNMVDNIRSGEGYEGVVSADGSQPPDPTDGFVQQNVKAAFDQGRDYNFVRMEQEAQATPVPPSIATLQQIQLLILLALSKGMAATA